MSYFTINTENAIRPSSVWLPGEDIPKAVAHFKNPVGIEIGTDGGGTTTYLLDSIPNLTLHGIDPYTPYIDWGGNPFSWHGGLNADQNSSYDEFMKKVSRYGSRYVHHKKTSDDAVVDFDDESMDFIFVDGLHTYDQVLKDCENYYPKLKKGGVFCGHDFTVIQAVNAAVREFAQKNNITNIGLMRQDVWYWTKPF